MTLLTIKRVYKQAEGSTLKTALTTTFADGADISVDSVVDFGITPSDDDPMEDVEQGGVFVIRNYDRTITEEGTYDAVDEATNKLLRCTRPNPLNWGVGTFIEAGNPATLELLADGYQGDDIRNAVVGVPVRPEFWLSFPQGAFDEDEYRVAEASVNPDGTINEITGAPVPNAERTAMLMGAQPGQGTWQLDEKGFRLYNSAGTLTFNAESETGDLLITGEFQTRTALAGSIQIGPNIGLLGGDAVVFNGTSGITSEMFFDGAIFNLTSAGTSAIEIENTTGAVALIASSVVTITGPNNFSVDTDGVIKTDTGGSVRIGALGAGTANSGNYLELGPVGVGGSPAAPGGAGTGRFYMEGRLLKGKHTDGTTITIATFP